MNKQKENEKGPLLTAAFLAVGNGRKKEILKCYAKLDQ
jgi:hypothetical protein